MVFLLVNALPSTGSAGAIVTPIVRLLLRYYVVVRLPGNILKWTYGHPIRYLHPCFVIYACTGGDAPQCTRGFLSPELPYSSFSISDFSVKHGPPDSRAKGFHACQDAQTPPGPPITRINAMVDVAFPIQARGRHPEDCDFGAQCP